LFFAQALGERIKVRGKTTLLIAGYRLLIKKNWHLVGIYPDSVRSRNNKFSQGV
jgi:hypothetical protein